MLEQHPNFPSQIVAARNVDIWLPPQYAANQQERFPVLYMHDGQNIFLPELAYTGIDWGIDETIEQLSAEGSIRPAIVVGVWNTPLRVAEYMPQKPMESPAGQRRLSGFKKRFKSEPLSDAYLRFLVSELKPWVDEHYRTLPDRANTLIMGSSMGGLISLYALCEYPHIFGSAGCLSSHWPAGPGILLEYMKEHLPAAGSHRLYFDYGTIELDKTYEHSQKKADTILKAAGYTRGTDWLTLKFEGAGHNEAAWRERLHHPVSFLLHKD